MGPEESFSLAAVFACMSPINAHMPRRRYPILSIDIAGAPPLYKGENYAHVETWHNETS